MKHATPVRMIVVLALLSLFVVMIPVMATKRAQAVLVTVVPALLLLPAAMAPATAMRPATPVHPIAASALQYVVMGPLIQARNVMMQTPITVTAAQQHAKEKQDIPAQEARVSATNAHLVMPSGQQQRQMKGKR